MRENRRVENWRNSPLGSSFGDQFLMQFHLVPLPLACRSWMKWKWQWILGVLVHKQNLNQELDFKEILKVFYRVRLWRRLAQLEQRFLFNRRQCTSFYWQSIWFLHHSKFQPKIVNLCVWVHGHVFRPKWSLQSTQIRCKMLLKSLHGAMQGCVTIEFKSC